MELLFELEPVSKREKLVERVRALRDLVDWVDVPDSPMGTSRFFSPMVSCIVKNMESKLGVIAHLRVIDVNRVALEAITKGLEMCGVERITFIRGDIVGSSSIVRDVEPEEAVKIVKAMSRLEPGLTISLRKSLGEIEGRLGAGASFYLVLNLNKGNLDKMEAVSRIARRFNVKLYPYVILLTEGNKDRILGFMERWKLLELGEALELIDSSNDLADGILVSSPGDFKGGLEFIERLRRR